GPRTLGQRVHAWPGAGRGVCFTAQLEAEQSSTYEKTPPGSAALPLVAAWSTRDTNTIAVPGLVAVAPTRAAVTPFAKLKLPWAKVGGAIVARRRPSSRPEYTCTLAKVVVSLSCRGSATMSSGNPSPFRSRLAI